MHMVSRNVCLEMFHDRRFLSGTNRIEFGGGVFLMSKGISLDFIVLLLMFWVAMLHKYPANYFERPIKEQLLIILL